MAVKINRGSALSSLNMTPLIDVVFLLLIFFLVATRFEEEERQLDIVLPQASEAQPLTSVPRELYINVDQKGNFTVNGRRLTERELFGGLRQAAANNPGQQTVIIRADKRCELEYVVTAMDLCNKAKIRDYRLTTAGPDG
jgi:biopolymer transport protein ExbD